MSDSITTHTLIRWIVGGICVVLTSTCALVYSNVDDRIAAGASDRTRIWGSLNQVKGDGNWNRAELQGLKLQIPELKDAIKELNGSVQALTIEVMASRKSTREDR